MRKLLFIVAMCAAFPVMAAIESPQPTQLIVELSWDKPQKRSDGSAIVGPISYKIYADGIAIATTTSTAWVSAGNYKPGIEMCASSIETLPDEVLESSLACAILEKIPNAPPAAPGNFRATLTR